jgi:hypothetical protein
MALSRKLLPLRLRRLMCGEACLAVEVVKDSGYAGRSTFGPET